ncbi:hypothetical protein AKO1_008312 [Acrasis kona]|uniref:EGF domain-specific O-linked N-acetylglucosamine transferase n=1 Tax=Acrasis kona TaxID=1008807 RepID=A0AAW2YP24_9EUKA
MMYLILTNIKVDTKDGHPSILEHDNLILKLKTYEDRIQQLTKKNAKPDEESIVKTKSDSDQNNLSVSDHEQVYWSKVGVDEHTKNCDSDFGFSLIDRWRKAKTEVCSSTTDSTIHCHKILQTGHSGTDNFCYVKNMILDVNKAEKPYLSGSMFSSCKKESSWNSNEYQLYLANLMSNVQTDTKKKQTKTLTGRTFFIERDGHANVFHSFTDIVNLFMAVLIHSKGSEVSDMKNNRIIILDSHDNGPFYDVWKLFGEVYRVEEFKKEYADQVIQFEDAVFGIPGGSNFLWKDVWIPNKCYESTILKAFVRFVMSEWKISEHKRRLPNEPIRILFSVRKHKNVQAKIGRRIMNEEELIKLLNEKLTTVSTDNKIPVQVTAIDLGTIGFKEQIEKVRQADIFVGMHGAGMTHVLWMHDESVVVELFPKGWHSSGMRNISKWLGRVYLSWQNVHDKNVADAEHLWTHVEEEEFLQVMKAASQIVQSFHLGSGVDHQNLKFVPK